MVSVHITTRQMFTETYSNHQEPAGCWLLIQVNKQTARLASDKNYTSIWQRSSGRYQIRDGALHEIEQTLKQFRDDYPFWWSAVNATKHGKQKDLNEEVGCWAGSLVYYVKIFRCIR